MEQVSQVHAPGSVGAQISAPSAARVAWLGLLAQAPWEELDSLSKSLVADVRFEWLRAPQQGLTLVRARIGNSGDRFNVGEATLTRCTLRLVEPGAPPLAGVGYVLGRSAAHAERMAQLDALLQWDATAEALTRDVLAPLEQARSGRHRAEAESTQSSRVQFFVLQPETP